MRKAINQHVLRTMLASLLDSRLPPGEMKRFAQDLQNPDILYQFQNAISGIADTLQHPEWRQDLSPSYDDTTALLDFIKRKRFSKEQVRARMLSIAPNLQFGANIDSMTMRDMVQAFMKGGSHRATQFINFFAESGQNDPYLKGIIRRDK